MTKKLEAFDGITGSPAWSTMIMTWPEMVQLETESTSHLPTRTIMVVVARNHDTDITSILLFSGSTVELNFGSYTKTFYN
jgi:hypothetical protein